MGKKSAPRKKRANTRSGGYEQYVQRKSGLSQRLNFYDTSTPISGVTLDNSIANGLIPATPDGAVPASALNCIPQGNGSRQRIGGEVVYHKVWVTGLVERARVEGSDVGHEVVRVYLVLDKQPNGAVMNPSDLFVNVSETQDLSVTPMKNMEKTKRFRVNKRN